MYGSIIVAALIAIAFVIVFIANFAQTQLSNSMMDWGAFGSYFTFITSIINLIFFIILTHKASYFQEKSHNHKMLAQKIELQTSLRKSHIDEIRQRMFDLSSFTNRDISKIEEFKDFKRDCDTLKRVFNIYQTNKNIDLLGDSCDYSKINKQFSVLDSLLIKVTTANVVSKDQISEIWKALDDVNVEIIYFEKCLYDYMIHELEKTFVMSSS